MISHSDKNGQSGFTLIELLAVLAILGLMTALLTSNRLQVSPAIHARAAAQAVAGALRQARGEAIAGNRSVALTLDVVNRTYSSGQRPAEALPPDLGLSLLTGRDELASGGSAAGRIRFDPDGGSSGGRVTITGGGQVWWVGVDWLSGRVSIAQQPR
jgi:general secretion pathway protein H